MNIDMPVGRYVVAVSGGIDSVALLDMLTQQTGHQLIVAHFDHGIREGSETDRKFVQDIAKKYGLQFVYNRAELGPKASEAVARKARYDFLHKVRESAGAQAVVTAHHQDDLLETAVLNLLRGTGRRGLSSLRSTDIVKRPLLHFPKQDLRDYIEAKGLTWREDETNTDTKYLRNYVRHIILPKLDQKEQQELLEHIRNARSLNQEIDSHLVTHLHLQPAISRLSRHDFIMLPHSVSCEVMAEWLRRHEVRNIDQKLMRRLVSIAKTSQPNRIADIDRRYILRITPKELALEPRDR